MLLIGCLYHLEMKGISNDGGYIDNNEKGVYHLEMKGISNRG